MKWNTCGRRHWDAILAAFGFTPAQTVAIWQEKAL